MTGYYCPGCNWYSRKLKLFNKHMERCLPVGDSYQCNECGEIMPKNDWRKHMMSHREGKHEKYGLDSHSSRTKVLVTDDGNAAIVKKAKVPNKVHKKQCALAVDADKLHHLRCTLGCPDSIAIQSKEEYLWCRRRTKKALGLLSVSVPIDAQSFVVFDHTSKQVNIWSNTSVVHLTLVDGYRVDKENYNEWLGTTLNLLTSLRASINNDPTITVESLHSVPRLSDKTTHLVVADVSASFDDSATTEMRKQCALPTFPLHLAVGACPSNDIAATLELASERLVGMKLNLDSRFLATLAPSLDEKFIPAYEKPSSRFMAQAKKRADKMFQEATVTASLAANEINHALYQSSVA